MERPPPINIEAIGPLLRAAFCERKKNVKKLQRIERWFRGPRRNARYFRAWRKQNGCFGRARLCRAVIACREIVAARQRLALPSSTESRSHQKQNAPGRCRDLGRKITPEAPYIGPKRCRYSLELM